MGEPKRLPKHIRPWMGDSWGRWEGDTLVVETTNIHPRQSLQGIPPSEEMRVIERFTRASEDRIHYEFTVEDPLRWEQPWRGEVPFNRLDGLVYEYACHEGNYALENVLRGARAEERREQMIMRSKHLTMLLGGIALLAVVAVPVVAHHAFGAEFDRNMPIRLQGKVVKLEWVNPHTWIHLEIENEDGTKEVWAVEGGTPNVLLRRGLRRDCLEPGTEIIVDGYQAKDHSLKRANGRDVTFTRRQQDIPGVVGDGGAV